MTQKVGIIGDALAPYFNEALANQMRLLSQELNAPVLTCNDIGFVPFKRMGNYLIVNGKFLREGSRKPLLSWLNGAFFYPFLKLFERRHDAIILSGGINSGFLSHSKLEKCILVMNSLPFSKESNETREFAQKFAPRLKGIVAQSKRIKERLLEIGLEAQEIHLIYPWVDLDRFKPTAPPPLDEFRILFASAPNAEIPGENIFEEKGIPLLLEAFKEFTQEHKARLRLLWRGYYNDALERKIKELDLGDKVEVVNEVVDTAKSISESHITVIPFLNTRRSPEIPLSAVESLACGRPLLATSAVEIADIIQEHECGCVSKPLTGDFALALRECERSYQIYQGNCREAVEGLFSLKTRGDFQDLI
ncbi:hypothetical protein ES703_125833 [subsurface metagenome]